MASSEVSFTCTTCRPPPSSRPSGSSIWRPWVSPKGPELVEIGGNLALLLPLGLRLPLVVGRDLGWRRTLLIGGALSVTIEVIQWRFALGVASTDDVLLNLAGVLLGYLTYRGLVRRHVHRPGTTDIQTR